MRVPSGFLDREDAEIVVRFTCSDFGTWEKARRIRDILGAVPSVRTLLSEAAELEGKEDYGGALEVLQKATKAYPHDAEAMNSLAWFLVTTPEKRLRDPLRALQLARDAVAATKGKAGHILDTLAVALHQNGDLIEALSYAEKAAGLMPDVEEVTARAKAYREELVEKARERRK